MEALLTAKNSCVSVWCVSVWCLYVYTFQINLCKWVLAHGNRPQISQLHVYYSTLLLDNLSYQSWIPHIPICQVFLPLDFNMQGNSEKIFPVEQGVSFSQLNSSSSKWVLPADMILPSHLSSQNQRCHVHCTFTTTPTAKQI